MLRNNGHNSEYLQTEFCGIRQYYRWLMIKKGHHDNPTDKIALSDIINKDIQFQNLFTKDELERLLKRNSRYKLLKWRDYLAISFYIYQGLTTGEICSLTISDVQVNSQKLFVIAGRNNSRILDLHSNQIAAFKRYITFDRPFLTKVDIDALFIGKLGMPETGDGLHYLIESQRGLFPDRKLNPKTIRQSVIANLLASGKDIMEVKLFAGHKSISSTERYIQTDLSEINESLLQSFPNL
jgi:integrase/recombinase XerD